MNERGELTIYGALVMVWACVVIIALICERHGNSRPALPAPSVDLISEEDPGVSEDTISTKHAGAAGSAQARPANQE